MKIVKVKIADLAALKDQGILMTVGLGSCVGITLYDEANKVGGMAHIFLADSTQFSRERNNSFNGAKFADTAIPLLVEEMEKLGGWKNRFKARIAGGSQLFSFQRAGYSVGEKNVEKVKETLDKLGIPLAGEDTGGNHGRTLRLFLDTGRVIISTVGKGEKEI